MTEVVSETPSSIVRILRKWRWRRRTPLVMQLEAIDCGAACLGIVLAQHGSWVPMDELREECQVGRDGSNLHDIALAAKKYGLDATGQSCSIRQLRDLTLPAILFWGFNHFVVLERISDNRYYLNDPSQGHRVVSHDTFNRDFTGVALVLKPGNDFKPTGARPGLLRRLWPWFQGNENYLARSAFYGVLLTVIALALPILLTLFVDGVLVGRQADWNVALIAAMFAIGALTYLLTWLQMRSLRELVVRSSISQSDKFLDRLLRLPMRFFAHRYSGDLVFTMRLIDKIADAGAGQCVRLCIDVLLSVAFLAIMLVYDVWLSLVVVGLGLTCVTLINLLTRLRRDKNHRLRREQGQLIGVSAAGLKTVEVLQATAREHEFYSRWSGRQARELRARQEFMELGHVTAALPQLFQIIVAAAVFGLGGWRVMSAEMTVGVLIGFYVLADNFLRPLLRLAQFSNLLQSLDADLVKVNDVFNASVLLPQVDPAAKTTNRVMSLQGRLRLSGRLELCNVSFGFQRNREPLIKDLNLKMEPGQRVAVVGLSGSGKSTFAKLVAGLYQPWDGSVLFDGHPHSEIPREVFCRSVAIVDQMPILFSTSIRNNLTMWDETVPDKLLTAAAKDADIHEEIIRRPAGYESAVEEGGRNFSGGQRLSLEIARALVQNPSLLILDEATSALDATTESVIDDRIRRRGCSCLIIAHRLSTIRDADRIVVLDEGRIVEQGVHESLYAGNGFYRRLLDGR